jgi:hypothetical protein
LLHFYQKIMTESTTEALAGRVRREIVYPSMYEDASDTATWRFRWRKISNVLESISKLALGAGTVLSFAAGFFTYPLLSFMAGCASSLAMTLMILSSYARAESHQRTIELNMLLTKIGIELLPDLTAAEESTLAKGALRKRLSAAAPAPMGVASTAGPTLAPTPPGPLPPPPPPLSEALAPTTRDVKIDL